MPANDSAVTITLSLIGQREVVAGLGDTAAALKDLQDTAVGANDTMVASSESMSADVAASYARVADAAAATADTVDSSDARAGDATKALAEQTTAATDSIIAQFDRMAAASDRSLATGAGSVAGSSGRASQGLMGTLTSMKTLVTAGMGYESLKAFSTYQGELTKLGTLAGITGSQIDSINKSIMGTAVALGQSPTALATAYYNPISEGFGVNASKSVVSAASKLAGISGAPLSGPTGTSYAVSTFMQTLGLPKTAAGANQAAAMLRGGVAAGDMTLPQLLAANSTGYFNTAQSYGVSEQSSMGLLDFFSSQGVSPESAATRLRMTFALMSAPSAQSAKYLQAQGLTQTDITGVGSQLTALGLTPTKLSGILRQPDGGVKAVQAVVAAQQGLPSSVTEALDAKLFGGGRSEATFLSLANHPQLAEQAYQRVGQLSTVQGFTDAWTQYTKTMGFEMSQLKVQFQLLEIEVGQKLVPAFQGLVTALGPLLKLMSTNIGSMVVAGTLLGLLVRRLTGLGGASLFGRAGAAAGGTTAAEGAAAGGLTVSPLAALGLAAGAAVIADKANAYADKTSGAKSIGARLYAGLVGGGPVGAIANLFASGGVLPTYATGGMMTSRPTAIVGEGRQSYPEFVIPTDPQYRSRARGLASALLPRLMASGGTVGGNSQLSNVLRRAGQTGLFSAEQLFNSQVMSYVVQQQLNSLGTAGLLGGGGGGSTAGGGVAGLLAGVTGSGGSPTSNSALGRSMAAALGWTGDEWTALNNLITRESGWSNTAANPKSGAYGIGQALPPTKYPLAAQAAGGSSARAQIQWTLNYIKGRYGDPLGAWAHEMSNNWYAAGGTIPQVKPLLFDAGGMVPEGVSMISNQTGAPEPLQRVGAGSSQQPLVVQVMIDKKVIGETVIRHLQNKVARS